MTVTFRPTVSGAAEFLKWAASSTRGETVTYHVGNLGADRTKHYGVHLVAEAALLLNETGWVSATQVPLRTSGASLSTYFAQRTGKGTAPTAILMQQITAPEFRALRVVRDRGHDMSAVRAIRDTLGYSEDVAADYLMLLLARRFIEPGAERGWQLSSLGYKMLL